MPQKFVGKVLPDGVQLDPEPQQSQFVGATLPQGISVDDAQSQAQQPVMRPQPVSEDEMSVPQFEETPIDLKWRQMESQTLGQKWAAFAQHPFDYLKNAWSTEFGKSKEDFQQAAVIAAQHAGTHPEYDIHHPFTNLARPAELAGATALASTHDALKVWAALEAMRGLNGVPGLLGPYAIPAVNTLNAANLGLAGYDLYKNRHDWGIEGNTQRALDLINIGMSGWGLASSTRFSNWLKDQQALREGKTPTPVAPPAEVLPQAETPTPAFVGEQLPEGAKVDEPQAAQPVQSPLVAKAKQVEPILEPSGDELSAHHARVANSDAVPGFTTLPEAEQLERARVGLKTNEAQVAQGLVDLAKRGQTSQVQQFLAAANPRVREWYRQLGGPEIASVTEGPSNASSLLEGNADSVPASNGAGTGSNPASAGEDRGTGPGSVGSLPAGVSADATGNPRVAVNPNLSSLEDELRQRLARVKAISDLRTSGKAITDRAAQDATGLSLRTLRERYLNSKELDEYDKLTSRQPRTAPKKPTFAPSEQAALDALNGKPAEGQAVKQFIKDNELTKEVNTELLKRFMATQPRGAQLDRNALREFAAKNMSDVERAVALRYAEIHKLAPPSSITQPSEAAQVADISGHVTRNPSEAGMGGTEEAKARRAELNQLALRREELAHKNAIARSLLPKWQAELTQGGETSFTADELRGFPPGVRKAIQSSINAKPVGTEATEASSGAVVPKPAETAEAVKTPATTAPAASAESVEVGNEEAQAEAEEGMSLKEKLELLHHHADAVNDASKEVDERGKQFQENTEEKEPGGFLVRAEQDIERLVKVLEGKAPQAETPSANGNGTKPPTTANAGATTPPGAPGRPNMTISDLANSLEAEGAEKLPLKQQIRVAREKYLETPLEGTKTEISSAWARMKATAASLYNWWRHPQIITQWQRLVDQYSGAEQISVGNAYRMAQALNRQTADPASRRAMAAWLEFGGDDDLLKEAASVATDARTKAAFEQALKMSDKDLATLKKLQMFRDSEEQAAKDSGILRESVENYIMHRWKPRDPVATQMLSQLSATELQPNPNFIRQRVFRTMIDGMKEGWTPELDVGRLLGAHHIAFSRAVAARALLRSLTTMKDENDGRPVAVVAGLAQPVESEEGKAFLLHPDAANPKDADGNPINTGDYRILDHRSTRQWKWVANGPDGSPIFYQGDLKIHPDWAKRIDRMLAPSSIRSNAFGRGLLSGSAFMKGNLLGFSAFHQVQETVHALGHQVDPFNLPKLDLSKTEQQFAVNSGLMLTDFHGAQMMDDGFRGSQGLAKYVPYFGMKLQQYEDWLFRNYIPRLKLATWQKTYMNLRRQYPQISDQDAGILAARVSNSAFGGLNWREMGASQSMQDALRMFFLAPDFMLARIGFTHQALSGQPEAAAALMRIATTQYVTARILNQLDHGDPEWAPQDSFSYIHNGTRYQLRSVPTDILRFETEPRPFVEHRLNPSTTRTGLELLTGRDEFGRERTPSQEALDYFKNDVPIALQGPVKRGDQTFADTFAESMGVEASTYHTPGEALALAYMRRQLPTGPEDSVALEQQRTLSDIRKGLNNGTKSLDDIGDMVNSGKLSVQQAQYLLDTYGESDIQRWTKGLKIEAAMDVYRHANAREKEQLEQIMLQKIANVSDPTLQEKYLIQAGFMDSKGNDISQSSPHQSASTTDTSHAILAPYANPEDEPAQQSFARNKQWAKPGPYTTHLSPQEEQQFQKWVRQNQVPWTDSPTADYDMRGFWRAMRDSKVQTQRNPWDGKLHFPDTWKTPYDATFSNQSMYAKQSAPHWQGDRLVTADGRLVVDETPKQK